jgi:antitoxin VapB
MALHIRDPEVDRLVRDLAEIRRISLTDAIKVAVQNELDRTSIHDRIRPIQDEVRSWGSTSLVADKAFYDSLNDE